MLDAQNLPTGGLVIDIGKLKDFSHEVISVYPSAHTQSEIIFMMYDAENKDTDNGQFSNSSGFHQYMK